MNGICTLLTKDHKKMLYAHYLQKAINEWYMHTTYKWKKTAQPTKIWMSIQYTQMVITTLPNQIHSSITPLSGQWCVSIKQSKKCFIFSSKWKTVATCVLKSVLHFEATLITIHTCNYQWNNLKTTNKCCVFHNLYTQITNTLLNYILHNFTS